MYDPDSTTGRNTGDYLRHPLPPSEWTSKKSRRLSFPLIGAFITTALVSFLLGAVVLYWITGAHSSLPVPQQAYPQPTLDAGQAMTSGDFSLFMRGFVQAMGNKQYDLIKKSVDTNNFQGIILYADGGYITWQDTYTKLTSGQMSFAIHQPIIMLTHMTTQNQVNQGCIQYTQHGIPGLMNVDAQAIQYVVGTTNESASSNGPTVQTAPDSTIFVFERPNGPGNFWLWRGYTLNNQQHCIA